MPHSSVPRRLAPLALLLSACAADPTNIYDPLDPEVAPITEGEWSRFEITTTWQWQLTTAEGVADIDTSYDVDVYDIDLFEVPAEQIAVHERRRIHRGLLRVLVAPDDGQLGRGLHAGFHGERCSPKPRTQQCRGEVHRNPRKLTCVSPLTTGAALHSDAPCPPKADHPRARHSAPLCASPRPPRPPARSPLLPPRR